MWVRPARQATSVFAPVANFFFSEKEEAGFKTYLADRSAHTEVVPIVDYNQLCMAADGRLSDSQYRYTVIGFNAVCNTIAPGLASVFYELSGENPRKIVNNEEFNVPAAVGIYNTAARVRFPALADKSLLVTHNEKIAEGLLSVEHKFLDNEIFYALLQEEVTSRQAYADFYRAEMIGREMGVYMMNKATVRADFLPDSRYSFAAGWFFSNREDTGSAVFAAPCLFTRFGPAVRRQRGTRLSHVGADLVGRTASLVARIAAQTIDMDKVRSQVRMLASKKIGFSDNKKENDAAIARAVNFLCRHGVRRDTAKSIVQSAATVGSDLEPRDFSVIYDTRILKSRTLYDLVCSLLRHSKTQPTHSRLHLQAAAMEIICPAEKKPEKPIVDLDS